MRIEITSTLTQDDEKRVAAAVLKALSGLLDILPIAYIVRAETTDAHVMQHVSPPTKTWESVAALSAETVAPAFES